MKPLLSNIKRATDSWYLKKVLKPIYLPVLHKINYRRDNKRFQKEGDSILASANKALGDIGLFYWVEFGTLLGVIRDGELISHDTDLDIGVFIEDYSPKIEKSMAKYGFKKTRRFEIDNGEYGLEESYDYKGVSFDIFYFTRTGEGMYCHLFPVDKNKNHVVRELHTKVNTFKPISWKGIEINVPVDADQRLKDTYGNYKIKIKEWYTPDDALNSRIIDKSCKIFKY